MTMTNKNFACLILTHGRPDQQWTIQTLRKRNYTGAIYLVADDEDETLPQYREKFGESLIVFCKEDAAAITDRGDTGKKKNVVVFARNMVFQIAEKLGLETFLMLDDDYKAFEIRYPCRGELLSREMQDLDYIFDAYLDFLNSTPTTSICFAQGGDQIGGVIAFYKRPILRKAMNAFFCRTDRPFDFMGRINEDVSAYVLHGSRGKLFLTPKMGMVVQYATQSQTGGLTEAYLELGTYVKSFYSVMMMPSAVKVSLLQTSNPRIHHRIFWKYCVPRLLAEKWKKEA